MKQTMVRNSVRETRTNLGLTQEQLAELVRVARQSIIAIEKGHFLPSIETTLRLSTALKKPVESLFWLEEENE